MEWSADGTLIHKLTYVDGKKEGTEELYYPGTGKTRSHSEWKDGKQDGLTATYNAAGDLESSQHFAAGERVYTPEEAHTIADQQARDAYDHCIKSAEMNGVGAGRPSTEGVTQQQDAYFTPSWTAISRQAGQAFHAKVDTDFTASWTAISREAGQ
jgi:hypothetical protein